MLAKIKFIMSGIGAFLWPILREFMVAAAPVVKELAETAVREIALSYVENKLPNPDKQALARDRIINQLATQGITAGADVSIRVINNSIDAAVKHMNGEA